MEDAEVLRRLIVLAHGIGDAGAGVHATQRGSDESEEHGDGLSQHEVLSMALAEQAVANNDHHVADGRGGAACHGHCVSGVEEVVCREILKQVAKQPLNEERSDDGDGNVLGWIFGFASHRSDRFEADQDENCNCCLDEHVAQLVRHYHGRCGGVRQEIASGISLGVVDGEGNRLACGIQQGQRRTGCVAHRRPVLGSCELIGIGSERLTVILEGGRTGRVAGAIAES